jgi:alginate O-acetyltransferase complex protein AlgI
VSLASFPFLAFLAAVWAVFGALPDRLRPAWLLVASLAFYATAGAPHLLVVLAVATGVAWAAAPRLTAATPEPVRRRVFWAAVGLEVALLASQRYLPALLRAAGVAVPAEGGLLPAVGVSYFTFQAISYLADVYLDVHPPERDLGRLALSLAFFPKVLQGPIERAGDLLPQLRRPFRFDYAEARAGLLLVAWGLFEKLVVADRAAPFADAVYGDPQRHSGLPLLVATYAFAIQILFDFAGYTDIALGAARLFGVRLTPNFDAPYLATSVAEFWRRWHISFSRWLLDYVFRPLQLGWRGLGVRGTALALVATFLVSGVWHGATWGFVIWGALHGAYLAAAVLWKPVEKRLARRLGLEKLRAPRAWKVLVTFHLVCLAWVFFRAATVRDAVHVLTHAWPSPPPGGSLGAHVVDALLLGRRPAELAILVAAVGVAVVVGAAQRRGLPPLAAPLRWSAYALLAFAIAVFHSTGGAAFLYARF